MLPDPLRITLLVTHCLEKIGIRYLIGGSLASTIYGRIRTTQDADIVAEMKLEHIDEFVNDLVDDFFIDEQMVYGAIEHNSSFNIIHRKSMFKVDVFIPSESPYTRIQLDRAKRQLVLADSDAAAYFASPEDTILSKLMWFRLGGEQSERQWEDVVGILKIRIDDLDVKYMGDWALKLNVQDLLEKAIHDAI